MTLPQLEYLKYSSEAPEAKRENLETKYKMDTAMVKPALDWWFNNGKGRNKVENGWWNPYYNTTGPNRANFKATMGWLGKTATELSKTAVKSFLG